MLIIRGSRISNPRSSSSGPRAFKTKPATAAEWTAAFRGLLPIDAEPAVQVGSPTFERINGVYSASITAAGQGFTLPLARSGTGAIVVVGKVKVAAANKALLANGAPSDVGMYILTHASDNRMQMGMAGMAVSESIYLPDGRVATDGNHTYGIAVVNAGTTGSPVPRLVGTVDGVTELNVAAPSLLNFASVSLGRRSTGVDSWAGSIADARFIPSVKSLAELKTVTAQIHANYGA